MNGEEARVKLDDGAGGAAVAHSTWLEVRWLRHRWECVAAGAFTAHGWSEEAGRRCGWGAGALRWKLVHQATERNIKKQLEKITTFAQEENTTKHTGDKSQLYHCDQTKQSGNVWKDNRWLNIVTDEDDALQVWQARSFSQQEATPSLRQTQELTAKHTAQKTQHRTKKYTNESHKHHISVVCEANIFLKIKGSWGKMFDASAVCW